MKSLLSYALYYIDRGWPVFPCHSVRPDARCTCNGDCSSPGKHPIPTGGCRSASLSMNTVRAWWEHYPWANVGIATGQVVVLDVDVDKGGTENLRKLEDENGALPETVISLTGGGGEHYLFTPPEGVQITNRARVGGYAGLDIRGEGGYIIAPPSLHLSGQRYLWDVAHRPGEVALAPVPSWLLKLMIGPVSRKSHPERLTVAETRIPVGTRNEKLFRDACALRDKGYDSRTISGFLRAANYQCIEPLGVNELDLILSSVMRYDPTVPGNGKLRDLGVV